MTDKRQKALTRMRDKTIKDYGPRSSALGNETYVLNVVPTCSLMLDYKLGCGGFPYGSLVEVFGGNNLGKSTVLGYGTLANVQKEGKIPALIAMEPGFDAEWGRKLHGLDPDLLLVQYPDNVQEAMDMLYDLVYNFPEIDYIMIDSVGAMGNESSQTDDGARKKAYGVSGEITAGLQTIMPRLWKNNQGLLIINQVRQTGQTRQGYTLHESPGGEALKHFASIRIQLKPGSNRYKVKIDGDDVLVGRELKATLVKNKKAQATNKAAEFDFFHIETEEYGLGIDRVSDVVRVGKVAGVIKEPSKGWYEHDMFPKGKLQGMPKARQFFVDHPEAFNVIREEVMNRMVENEIALAQEEEASNGGARNEQAAVD